MRNLILSEVIAKLRERLGQASPSTPETGVEMEGFACQNRSFAIGSSSQIQVVVLITKLPGIAATLAALDR